MSNGCTFLLQVTTWQVLRTSCWVPLRVLLYSNDGILNLTFFNWDFVMPSRSAPAFQFTQLKPFDLYFSPRSFVDISYLTHVLITSLVTFAELCSLLCYEFFALKFR